MTSKSTFSFEIAKFTKYFMESKPRERACRERFFSSDMAVNALWHDPISAKRVKMKRADSNRNIQ